LSIESDIFNVLIPQITWIIHQTYEFTQLRRYQP